MNKTFFIRLLENGKVFVKNNDKNETKVLVDTEALKVYIDECMGKEKKDDKK
jgi:hypothetical protein